MNIIAWVISFLTWTAILGSLHFDRLLARLSSHARIQVEYLECGSSYNFLFWFVFQRLESDTSLTRSMTRSFSCGCGSFSHYHSAINMCMVFNDAATSVYSMNRQTGYWKWGPESLLPLWYIWVGGNVYPTTAFVDIIFSLQSPLTYPNFLMGGDAQPQ